MYTKNTESKFKIKSPHLTAFFNQILFTIFGQSKLTKQICDFSISFLTAKITGLFPLPDNYQYLIYFHKPPPIEKNIDFLDRKYGRIYHYFKQVSDWKICTNTLYQTRNFLIIWQKGSEIPGLLCSAYPYLCAFAILPSDSASAVVVESKARTNDPRRGILRGHVF